MFLLHEHFQRPRWIRYLELFSREKYVIELGANFYMITYTFQVLRSPTAPPN